MIWDAIVVIMMSLWLIHSNITFISFCLNHDTQRFVVIVEIFALQWINTKVLYNPSLCETCGKVWYSSCIIIKGPFHERIVHRNSNPMEISFRSHPSCGELIAMKFCKWHGSCFDMILYNSVVSKPNLPSNLNYNGKTLVKWVPEWEN